MSSFQIWCLLQVSKKLARGQQRAEKARNFEKIQLGEHLANNNVNWHQVCNIISYKRDVLERQGLSEVKMGRGSPTCERVRKKIVEYFKNNVPQHQIAKALQISSSTVHNIIKRFRESGEISVRKGQGRRPLLDARGLRALRWHCITHRHDSVIEITKWAQEYIQKPLSVNTIRRAICKNQLNLYHAKRKPYVNMVQKRRRVLWAKAHLKWFQSGKVFYGQTSPNLTFLMEIMDTVSSGLKRRETFLHVISIQFKSQHLWWYRGA